MVYALVIALLNNGDNDSLLLATWCAPHVAAGCLGNSAFNACTSAQEDTGCVVCKWRESTAFPITCAVYWLRTRAAKTTNTRSAHLRHCSSEATA